MYLIKLAQQRRAIRNELESLGCTRRRAKFAAKNAFSSYKRPWYVKLYAELWNRFRGLVYKIAPWHRNISYELVTSLYNKGLIYISQNSPILIKIKEDE